MAFLRLATRMPGKYLKIGHDSLLLSLCLLIIHEYLPMIFDAISLNNQGQDESKFSRTKIDMIHEIKM